MFAPVLTTDILIVFGFSLLAVVLFVFYWMPYGTGTAADLTMSAARGQTGHQPYLGEASIEQSFSTARQRNRLPHI